MLSRPITRIGSALTKAKEGPPMNASRSQTKLKLFDPENLVADRPKMKRVRLKQIVRVLFDAAKSDRTWLSDFAEDEIKISADLYETLTMYRRLRPSA